MQDDNTSGKKRTWLRRAGKLVGWGVVLLAVGLLFWLRGALYHRFVKFPREETAWQTLRAQRQHIPNQSAWNEYRGILHSHSKLSHDSEVPFEEDPARPQDRPAGLHLPQRSPHRRAVADFSLQWRGVHDGKLFIPGFEMRDGIMPFGVAPGVVLEQPDRFGDTGQADRRQRRIAVLRPSRRSRGTGIAPNSVGMEIYNIHTDFNAAAPALAQHAAGLVRSTSAAIRSMCSARCLSGRRSFFGTGTS